MNVLVLGGSGQIGHEIVRELAWLGPVTAPARRDADLERPDVVRELVRHVKPDVVVNAAGYTAVDAAESDAEACRRLNAELPEILAECCKSTSALLVHFSSDYVFDGKKRTPYLETDDARPLSTYGASKLAGDRAVESSGAPHLIFRTSWVYASRGRNFVRTMLRLSRERDTLSIVNDQVGAPTSAPAIASAVSQVVRSLAASDLRGASEEASGLYNLTASGSTTWYEFALAILAADRRRSEQIVREVRPIATSEYPTPARRPAYSVLDNTQLERRFGVRLGSWQDQWRAVAAQLSG